MDFGINLVPIRVDYDYLLWGAITRIITSNNAGVEIPKLAVRNFRRHNFCPPHPLFARPKRRGKNDELFEPTANQEKQQDYQKGYEYEESPARNVIGSSEKLFKPNHRNAINGHQDRYQRGKGQIGYFTPNPITYPF